MPAGNGSASQTEADNERPAHGGEMCPLCGGIGRRWGQRSWNRAIPTMDHLPASASCSFVLPWFPWFLSMGFFCLLAVVVVIPESRQSGMPSTRPMDCPDDHPPWCYFVHLAV